jgi:AMP deaminase
MHAHPSATNMADQSGQFSTLPSGAMSGPLGPTQQARQNQSAAGNDGQVQPASPTTANESDIPTRPRRSSSVTINPSIVSAPLPSGGSGSGTQQQQQGDGSDLGLTRTRSSVALDGEPRMFPGIVSKNARRSSMRSTAVEDGSYAGFRNGDAGSVAEAQEKDTDDEE